MCLQRSRHCAGNGIKKILYTVRDAARSWLITVEALFYRGLCVLKRGVKRFQEFVVLFKGYIVVYRVKVMTLIVIIVTRYTMGNLYCKFGRNL